MKIRTMQRRNDRRQWLWYWSSRKSCSCNGWERVGLWQWWRFDDEGFDYMYDSDEFDNKMAEEEVVKKFDKFQSDYEWKWSTRVEWISQAKVIKLGLNKLWAKSDCSHLQQRLYLFGKLYRIKPNSIFLYLKENGRIKLPRGFFGVGPP